ncbi:MAG: hypothetical protein ACOY90_08365 [Candidatus Zhuqueibacterota bacterium]
MRRTTVLLIITLSCFGRQSVAQNNTPEAQDSKVIIIPQNQSRTFMFTNQSGLFYCGETSLPNTSQFHGLSYLTHEFLEDYIVDIGGTELKRSASEVHLFSKKFIRFFKNTAIQEEVAIADSLPALIVKITSDQKAPMTIAPVIAGSNQAQDYVLYWSTSDKILYIAKKHHLVRDDDNNYPIWIGVCTFPNGEYTTGYESLPDRDAIIEDATFVPGKLNVYLEGDAYIFFIIDDSKAGILRKRNRILKKLEIDFEKSNSQIDGVRQAWFQDTSRYIRTNSQIPNYMYIPTSKETHSKLKQNMISCMK